MGRKSHCTVEEARLVSNLKTQGKSLWDIGKIMKRFPNFVKNALKRKPKRGTRGRPQKPNTVLDRTDLEMSWFGDVFLGIG